MREIVVARPDHDQPVYLLTNDLQRPAGEIAQLYKERWDIELLFKWLKQNLKIRSFLGRSQNAVRIQIYVALIAFMLLRILHHTAARAYKDSTALLLTHIKFGLFDAFSLCQAKPRLPNHPPGGRQTRNLTSLSGETNMFQNPGQQCAFAGMTNNLLILRDSFRVRLEAEPQPSSNRVSRGRGSGTRPSSLSPTLTDRSGRA